MESYGIVLDDSKRDFLSVRLLPRLEELRLNSFLEYYTYLKFAPQSDQEQERFIPLITNNETYFYREESQLKLFSSEVLPALKGSKTAKGSRRLTVVSAGCSTGEEAYTLAMLILDSGLFLWDWEINVIGVDLDPEVLERARQGHYRSRAFQTLPAHYQDRYFLRGMDGLRVRDSVRALTRFVRGNILELDRWVTERDVDVLFCRNVFIYFPDHAVRQGVESFSRMLGDDGWLFLGHSESLSRISGKFEPFRGPGAIAYRLRKNPET